MLPGVCTSLQINRSILLRILLNALTPQTVEFSFNVFTNTFEHVFLYYLSRAKQSIMQTLMNSSLMWSYLHKILLCSSCSDFDTHHLQQLRTDTDDPLLEEHCYVVHPQIHCVVSMLMYLKIGTMYRWKTVLKLSESPANKMHGPI